MSKIEYQGSLALEEHMLSGNSISRLEALILFGVQNLTAANTIMKRKGNFIKTRRVPMAKIIRRLNQYCVCQPPKNLPMREIVVSEYWISK